jgi:cytochrome P450
MGGRSRGAAFIIMVKGPPAHPIKGHLPQIARDPLAFFTECARSYGDVVDVRLGPRHTLQLSNPHDIESVLVKNNHAFAKHPAMNANRLLLGEGLVVSEGAVWQQQRRAIQPAFHRQRIAEYADLMVAFAQGMVDGWRDGETRDIHSDLMQLTIRLVSRALFHADMDAEASSVEFAQREIMDAFRVKLNSLFFLLPEAIPTPANLRMRRAVYRLEELLYRGIVRGRSRGQPEGDLLSLVLGAPDPNHGGRMSGPQIRDEVVNFFFAGYETSVNALSWTCYLLARHPEIQHRVHAEVTSVLGGRTHLTAGDAERLSYTEQAVTEAIRLYPPIWMMGRRARVATSVGGYRVPRGGLVQMSQWVVHRDPRWYDRPDEYRPERWTADFTRQLPRFAYFPFGAGPRRCVGRVFAMLEAVLVVSTIVRHYHLSLAGDPVVPRASLTLHPHPDHGLRLKLNRRSPESSKQCSGQVRGPVLLGPHTGCLSS